MSGGSLFFVPLLVALENVFSGEPFRADGADKVLCDAVLGCVQCRCQRGVVMEVKARMEDRRQCFLLVACRVGTRTGDVPVQVLLPGIPAGALCGNVRLKVRRLVFGSRWGFSFARVAAARPLVGGAERERATRAGRAEAERESGTYLDRRTVSSVPPPGWAKRAAMRAASASVSAKGWGAGGASEQASLLTGRTLGKRAGEGPDSAVGSESR